jgi:isopenicillin N synthase-like dioxygenase
MTSQMIPIIDIGPLLAASDRAGTLRVAREIRAACTDVGFFYVRNFERVVPARDTARLERLARAFFAQSTQQKMRIAMKNSGLHWKGYFPSGDELTSGAPDAKEGIYFGEEYAVDTPQVRANFAMHGPNQFPEPRDAWRDAVMAHMDNLTRLGTALMRGMAISLDLPPDYFTSEFCQPRPFTPFRIFHYPGSDIRQGVGRHTDYGCLTILWTDEVGGLEVETRQGEWIAADPIPGTFIVNVGDMMETWTGGKYKATPHRVRAGLPKGRISMPFFFDPAFECTIRPGSIKNAAGALDASVAEQMSGKPIRYGDYITHKIRDVFPDLFEDAGMRDVLVERTGSSKL